MPPGSDGASPYPFKLRSMACAILLVVVVVLVLDLLEAHLLVASFIPRAGTIGSGETRATTRRLVGGSSVAHSDARRPVRTEPLPTPLSFAPWLVQSSSSSSFSFSIRSKLTY